MSTNVPPPMPHRPAPVPGSTGSTGSPMPPMPPPPPPLRGPGRGSRLPRSGFAALVLTGALLVGGGAGVGGAAAWSAVADDSSDSGGGTSPTALTVADTPDTPAADGSVEDVASSVLPSVVKIDVQGSGAAGRAAGSGSGIVLSADGLILTNDHVVTLGGEVPAEEATIRVSFSDGSHATATVVGTDPLTDTAVIRAEDVSDLTPITIGQSENLDVGEQVVAIGSPYGLDATVTSGIVSALDRPVEVGQDAEGNTTAYPAIQTDAAINPGNSGGPLVDMDGHLVGINASIQTASGTGEESGSIGLGFAIPIDAVRPIVEQLEAGETPTHARLGIQVSDAATSQDLTAADGARIEEITAGSAAEDADLRAGDVITAIDDTDVTGADSLVVTVRSHRPGDTVKVTYVRDGEERTTELELGSDA